MIRLAKQCSLPRKYHTFHTQNKVYNSPQSTTHRYKPRHRNSTHPHMSRNSTSSNQYQWLARQAARQGQRQRNGQIRAHSSTRHTLPSSRPRILGM